MSDAFFSDFAAELTGGPSGSLAARLANPEHAVRLAIYRNNVVSGAIEALRSAYPVVNAITGPRFFSPLARTHWQDNPPATRSLTLYGAGFAQTIVGYEPARRLPYLADIARLDRAWLEAHHATGGPVLAPDRITSLPPQETADLAPGLHASARLLALDWPVHALWQRHRAPPEDPRQASRQTLVPARQRVIVWRPFGRVQARPLDPPMSAFLSAIADGATLEAASLCGLRCEPSFQPAAAFAEALSAGYLSGALS